MSAHSITIANRKVFLPHFTFLLYLPLRLNRPFSMIVMAGKICIGVDSRIASEYMNWTLFTNLLSWSMFLILWVTLLVRIKMNARWLIIFGTKKQFVDGGSGFHIHHCLSFGPEGCVSQSSHGDEYGTDDDCVKSASKYPVCQNAYALRSARSKVACQVVACHLESV